MSWPSHGFIGQAVHYSLCSATVSWNNTLVISRSDRIMRRNPRFFRLTATVALTALLLDTVLPVAAFAQPAPPPLPPAPGQPTQNQGDPPARVGRVAGITGTVSFHNQGDTQWSPASVNYPVSSGNAFWTEPAAEAQLDVGDSRIALAGGSEFDIYTLDGNGLQGVAVQGESYVHLRGLGPDEAWSVQTPRGLVRLGGEGRYAIAVGSTDQPTLITVVEGSAQIEGPDLSLQVAAGQTATITGTDSFQGSVGPAQRDAFLTEQMNAERPAPPPPGVPAQVAAMPGGSDLYREGSWSEAPQYGQVWYPPVQQGWVPYRQGHWAYVAPWGWTWIDNAPWGFAPFHYGRWVEIGGRWAWTPGAVAVERPVYAPALVAFIGIGAGVALGAALASRSIGWVPLGPREQYRPWYHASDRYVREVNVNHVTNINRTNITNNNVTINNYINRGGATSIPAAAMAGSRPVQAIARPVSAQEFAQARRIVGQQPLRPSATTAGVTPVVARQLNLAPAAVSVRSAPGPAVRGQALGPGGAAFARPALVPAGRPIPNSAPGQAAAGAPSQVEPGHTGAPGAPNARELTEAGPNHSGGLNPGVPQRLGAAPNAVVQAHPGGPMPTGQAGTAVVPNATQPTNATQPNRPGGQPPGVQPTPGGALNAAQPIRPGGLPAGVQPIPGGALNATQPIRPGGLPAGVQPIPGGALNATQPIRPGGQPPGGQPATGGAPNAAQPIRPGGLPTGSQPVTGGALNTAVPVRPGGIPIGRPGWAGAPNVTTPAQGIQPMPGGTSNAFQPNRQSGGRPPGEPQFAHPNAPFAGSMPPAAVARPTAPQMVPRPVPAPAPAPMAAPHPAYQIAPAPRPEPHFAAPTPVAAPHFAAPAPQAAPHYAPPPQPVARPAPLPQPQVRPAPAAHEKRPGER
jgi:uncharacterized protein DUF6600